MKNDSSEKKKEEIVEKQYLDTVKFNSRPSLVAVYYLFHNFHKY